MHSKCSLSFQGLASLGESTEFDAMLGLIWLHMKRKGLAAMIVTLRDDEDGDVNESKGH